MNSNVAESKLEGGQAWLNWVLATAQLARKMVPEAHFAAVYAKPAGRPSVDTFVTEVSQDTWIVFPWDQE